MFISNNFVLCGRNIISPHLYYRARRSPSEPGCKDSVLTRMLYTDGWQNKLWSENIRIILCSSLMHFENHMFQINNAKWQRLKWGCFRFIVMIQSKQFYEVLSLVCFMSASHWQQLQIPYWFWFSKINQPWEHNEPAFIIQCAFNIIRHDYAHHWRSIYLFILSIIWGPNRCHVSVCGCKNPHNYIKFMWILLTD